MSQFRGKLAVAVAALTLGGAALALPTTANAASEQNQIVIKQLDSAPHGKQAFAVTTVAMRGDKILAAKIDEFQFMDKSTKGIKGVPNSDGDFGKSIKKGQVLVSKAENDQIYSGLMKKEGKATKDRLDSLNAIQDYAKGKTAKQLLATAKKNSKMQKKVISGATLVDTNGYVKSIANAAKKGYVSQGIASDSNNIALKQTLGAPHGTKAFGITTVAMDGDKILASNIDEFQFVAKKDFKGVPNSNSDFGKSYPKGQVLASKTVNDKAYSANMKKEAKATQKRSTSINAITKYAAGKTVSQIESDQNAHSKMTDVVSGATLADTNGYIKTIVAAAKE